VYVRVSEYACVALEHNWRLLDLFRQVKPDAPGEPIFEVVYTAAHMCRPECPEAFCGRGTYTAALSVHVPVGQNE
jgi:hypothetical protein